MVSDEVVSYLAGAGLGLISSGAGINLFDVPFPLLAPASAVCVFESSVEEKAEDTFGPSLSAEAVPKPHFEVLIRDPDPSAAKTTAWNIFKKLRNFSGTIASVRYLLIEAKGQPFFLKFEEGNQRAVYKAEFKAWKEESP